MTDVLRSAVREGHRRAIAEGAPVLVSISERVEIGDPLDLFSGADWLEDRVFWEHFDVETGQRLSIAGLGAAYKLPTRSGHHFGEAASTWRALRSSALIDAPADRWGVGPLLLGGFSFDPEAVHTALWDGFPDAGLTLPTVILAQTGEEQWLTISIVTQAAENPDCRLDAALRLREVALRAASRPTAEYVNGRGSFTPRDVMPAAEWQRLVGEAAGEVRHGEITKVVLARQVLISRPERSFDPGNTLARLRKTFPEAFLFAVARPAAEVGGTAGVFLGASPERLVRLHDGLLATSCLAGSIGRGEDAEADAALGARLLSSAKDLTEHAVVSEMLAESLAPVCESLEVAPRPGLLKLSNLQHLYTPIHGRLALRADGTRPCILDLLAGLHPTPAVGGYPRPDALALIRRREQLDRGWYAGPLGWLDQHGEGEFAVAIRSALLRGGEASLFAGCGIVGDSDPESEYRESCLKLKAMLGALTDPA
jgi:isochorismate synthase